MNLFYFVKIEWAIALLVYGCLGVWLIRTGRIRRVIWDEEHSLEWVGCVRILFLTFFLYPAFLSYAGPLLERVWPIEPGLAWKPIAWLTTRPLPLTAVKGIVVLGWVAWGLALIGYQTRWAMTTLCAYIIFVQACLWQLAPMWQFHFIEYMAVSMLFLPVEKRFSVDAFLRRRKNLPEEPTRPWPRAPQIVFVLFYAMAGLGKLQTVGLSWANGENMRGFIFFRAVDFGQFTFNGLQAWVSNHFAVTLAMQVASFVLELTAPLILIWPAYRWVILPMVLVLHGSVIFLLHFVVEIWRMFFVFTDPYAAFLKLRQRVVQILSHLPETKRVK